MREDETMTKKPFLKAKYRELKQISKKAVVVKSYDGQEDVLPVSQIKEGFDCIYIPTWLAERKNVQCSQKKYWT